MRILMYIVGAAVTLCSLFILAIFFVAPRSNWSAAAKPGVLEARIANLVRERWIAIHSPDQKNPFAPTPENLASGRDDYNQHCATCHGFDGHGQRQLEADFYPPVEHLTGDTQEMSDAEIFFVIANGVALSGMPAFARHHSPDELWKLVLWVRHLANLTSDERREIEQSTSDKEDGRR